MRDTETPDAKGITNQDELLQHAKELFKTELKHACIVPYPFSNKNKCMHRKCERQAIERIFFTSDDTVHQADVCTEHGVLFKQGNKVIFPFKLGYTPCKTQ